MLIFVRDAAMGVSFDSTGEDRTKEPDLQPLMNLNFKNQNTAKTERIIEHKVFKIASQKNLGLDPLPSIHERNMSFDPASNGISSMPQVKYFKPLNSKLLQNKQKFLNRKQSQQPIEDLLQETGLAVVPNFGASNVNRIPI